MGLISEFKQFVSRGNVLDLAVGIIIGVAFGKIVNSFVNDIIMPPLGVILKGVDFKDLKITLKDTVVENGKTLEEAVTINYGNFIQNIVEFLIVALAVFMLIKAINTMKRKKADEPVVIPLTNQEKLLTEIRDALQQHQKPAN